MNRWSGTRESSQLGFLPRARRVPPWYFRRSSSRVCLHTFRHFFISRDGARGLPTFLFSASFSRESFLRACPRSMARTGARPQQGFPDFMMRRHYELSLPPPPSPLSLSLSLSLFLSWIVHPLILRVVTREATDRADERRRVKAGRHRISLTGFILSPRPLHPRSCIIVLRCRRARCSTLYSITIHGKRKSHDDAHVRASGPE
jgi:hypothetical protein